MREKALSELSPTRRRFMSGALSFTLAGAAGLSPRRLVAQGTSETAWRGLAGKLSGRLLRPGDPGFEAAALPFNLRYAGTLPAGIAVCRNAEDVAAAILWARENEMPLVARSGGHSYAGYSTTTGLMISLAGIDAISFDGSSGIVGVGGGARNEAIYASLEKANATITHGRCPTVGAAGFVLGGGIGFNMRLLGLACDQLVATEMVTADGEIRTASAGENPDLFWACRGGGGGNFGINTAFRMQTAPAEPRTWFSLRWDEAGEALFATLIAALDAAPPTLGSRLSLDTSPDRPGVSIGLIGQIKASAAEARSILDPAISLAKPDHVDVITADYWVAERALVDADGPFAFHERSRFAVDPLGGDMAAMALGWLRRWPRTGDSGNLVLFQTGGRINEVAKDATAFVHRNSHWLADVALSWTEDDSEEVVAQALAWQDGFYADLLRFVRGGAYQNFIDPALDGWAEAYYGDNLPRLRRIKAAVDPDGVFTFPQSIPPA